MKKKTHSGATKESRRNFLKAAGTAAVVAATSAPVVAGAKQSSKPRPVNHYDVIIIGAGFCGVTAARECTQKGHSALILEARSRIGGRTFTTEFNHHMTDMGGTWVGWDQPYVWAEVKRYGIELGETVGATASTLITRVDGEPVRLNAEDIWDEVIEVHEQVLGASRQFLDNPHDPYAIDIGYAGDYSVAEKLQELNIQTSPAMQSILRGNLSTMLNNYSEKGAWMEMVRWYGLSGHDLKGLNDAILRYHLKGGTVSLLQAMLDDSTAELKLGTPVEKVSQKDGGVRVLTEDGEVFTASAVISTVPLNVLEYIDWEPALKEGKMRASQEKHAGSGTKVHVVLEGDLGNFICVSDERGEPLSYIFTESHGPEGTHVVGFGPSMDLLDVNDRDQVTEAVRRYLPDAKVKTFFGYQWGLDPYSEGTWCVFKPGQQKKYLRALQEPQGRVVFASSDWADGWRGFIDGAVEQGLWSAHQVDELLES